MASRYERWTTRLGIFYLTQPRAEVFKAAPSENGQTEGRGAAPHREDRSPAGPAGPLTVQPPVHRSSGRVVARWGKLQRARSRLHRSQILQVKTRNDVGKLSPRSKQCTLLHRLESRISIFSLKIAEVFADFYKMSQNLPGVAEFLLNFAKFDQFFSGFSQNAAILGKS